jgi:hypothetical protein
MSTMRFVILVLAISVLPQSQLFAKSCDERCDDAKDRCENNTSAYTGGVVDAMNCVVVQQRCTQEENAKLSHGGFPDISRCMQLGNDCTNRASSNANDKVANTTAQCDSKYDACMSRCN